MHRSTTLFLIGFCLIAILGFHFFVVQTHALVGAVIVVGLTFLAGAVTGYFICKTTTVTRYEAGVEKGDYIYNVAVTWDTQADNIERFSYNQKELSDGLRYYWFRKAEYTAQHFINESTFPTDKVAEESGIKQEYLNLTSSLLDSYDNVIASLNSFCSSTLPAFDTLTVKATYNIGYTIDLKGKDILGVFHLVGAKAFTFNFKAYYVDVPTSKRKIGVYINLKGSSDTPTVTFKILNSTDGVVQTESYTATSGQCNIKWYDLTSNLEEGEVYTLQIEQDAGSKKAIDMLVPICFIPYDDNYGGDGESIKDAYVIAHIQESASGDSHYEGVNKIEFYNETTVVHTITYSTFKPFPELSDAMVKHLANYRDALSAGQAYWNLLRTLGYDDYSEIPRNYHIPAPSVVDIGSDVTEKLNPEQLYALYIAYLKALEQFFTSETYRTSNVSSVDVKASDFSLVVNCTAYNSYGNETIFDKKLAILMPTVSDLVLEREKNNTLTQTVNVVYFSNTSETNQTVNYIQLKPDDIVYVYEFYKDGEFYNASSVTISIVDLKQLSFKYDFTLKGEPTYAYTDFNDWMPIIIAVLVISVVVAMVDKSRRKR